MMMLGGIWAVALRRLVATVDVSGRHIGSIFSVQPLKKTDDVLGKVLWTPLCVGDVT
jgi:hypothetical protein